MARLEKIVDELYERSDKEVFRILHAIADLALREIETGEPRSVSPESEFPSSQKEVHIGHTDPSYRPAPL